MADDLIFQPAARLAALLESARAFALAALFASLCELGGQVWMTGADPQAFADLTGRAALLHVSPGRIVHT